jgi:hypothetical protein
MGEQLMEASLFPFTVMLACWRFPKEPEEESKLESKLKPELEPEPEARGYTIFVDLKAPTNVFEIDLVEAFKKELIAPGEGNDNVLLERCKNKEEQEEIRIKFKEHTTLGVATKMVNVDDDEVAKLGEEGK